MKKILALTLGGSSEPIVRSVLDHNPNEVLFFVTTSPNGGSKKSLLEKVDGEESIISRTGLMDSEYEVHELSSPDDLSACYKQIKEIMLSVSSSEEECDCIADYTGGTKTMAVALVLAALGLKWKLSIVRGERTNLIKALNGTEMVRLVSTSTLLLDRTLKQATALFDLGQYEAVESMLRSFLSEEHVPEEDVSRVQQLFTLSRGFAAWDRFEHEKALSLLEAQARLIPQYVRSLKELLEEDKGSGYEKVWDLIKNAERRANQGRYDDAVLRLYRALEMFAQIRLYGHYEINTDDIKLDKLPTQARKAFDLQVAQRRKKITAGFYAAYHLLSDLNDPIGPIYNAWERKIRDLLDKRNRSILAHGEEPIGREVWEKIHTLTHDFLKEIASSIGVRTDWPQFPTWREANQGS